MAPARTASKESAARGVAERQDRPPPSRASTQCRSDDDEGEGDESDVDGGDALGSMAAPHKCEARRAYGGDVACDDGETRAHDDDGEREVAFLADKSSARALFLELIDDARVRDARDDDDGDEAHGHGEARDADEPLRCDAHDGAARRCDDGGEYAVAFQADRMHEKALFSAPADEALLLA